MALGYPKKIALQEARRCTQCANPVCSFACPLGIDIPGFIRAIRENEPDRALAIIKEKNLFASICGRICPAPCEKACVLREEGGPIGIQALERYAAETGRDRSLDSARSVDKKIAVIGAGASGMAAAAQLALHGYNVTVFESTANVGGLLAFGVPEFRVPKRILGKQSQALTKLGVQFRPHAFLGGTMFLPDLWREGFAAILLATGAGSSLLDGLPGQDLGGVFYAPEFLSRVNFLLSTGNLRNLSLPFGGRVAVIGQGMPALDCGRVAVRLGKSATVIFEKTEDEFPGRLSEKDYAKEEGVRMEPLAKAIGLVGDERKFVQGVQCIRMDFADPQSTGEWQLIPVDGSEFTIEADTVILATAASTNAWLGRVIEGLHVDPTGKIGINDLTGMTSIKNVFAVSPLNGGSVIDALAAGKKAAHNIMKFFCT